MDKRLQQALDFSNFMVTFNNQKRALCDKFKEDCLYFYKGSQFTINQDLLCFVNLEMSRSKDSTIIIDDSGFPVNINDIYEFYVNILTHYDNAVEEFYNEYNKLKNSRQVEKLVDYE